GVKTCLDVVENRNIDCSVRRTIERHTRWAKMRRAIAPGIFIFEPIMSPLVIATIVAVIARSPFAVEIAILTAIFQTILAHLSVRVLRGHALRFWHAPLEIVRSYLVFFCWLRAFVSRRIEWRGHPFLLKSGSEIVPAPPSSWRRLRAAVRV